MGFSMARFVRVKYDGTVESSPVAMASLTPIWSHLALRFGSKWLQKIR